MLEDTCWQVNLHVRGLSTNFDANVNVQCICVMPSSMVQVRTAWKVWRTWSNGGGETGLRFDDSNVQTKLAPGLIDAEKVSLSLSVSHYVFLTVSHCVLSRTIFPCLLSAVSSPCPNCDSFFKLCKHVSGHRLLLPVCSSGVSSIDGHFCCSGLRTGFDTASVNAVVQCNSLPGLSQHQSHMLYTSVASARLTVCHV